MTLFGKSVFATVIELRMLAAYTIHIVYLLSIYYMYYFMTFLQQTSKVGIKFSIDESTDALLKITHLVHGGTGIGTQINAFSPTCEWHVDICCRISIFPVTVLSHMIVLISPACLWGQQQCNMSWDLPMASEGGCHFGKSQDLWLLSLTMSSDSCSEFVTLCSIGLIIYFFKWLQCIYKWFFVLFLILVSPKARFINRVKMRNAVLGE